MNEDMLKATLDVVQMVADLVKERDALVKERDVLVAVIDNIRQRIIDEQEKTKFLDVEINAVAIIDEVLSMMKTKEAKP